MRIIPRVLPHSYKIGQDIKYISRRTSARVYPPKFALVRRRMTADEGDTHAHIAGRSNYRVYVYAWPHVNPTYTCVRRRVCMSVHGRGCTHKARSSVYERRRRRRRRRQRLVRANEQLSRIFRRLRDAKVVIFVSARLRARTTTLFLHTHTPVEADGGAQRRRRTPKKEGFAGL